MSARSQRCRIEKIEERIKKLSKYSSACICFPETEPPSFGFAVMRDIAFRVKCPLHGERFKVFSHLYVPRWHREHADRYRHLGSRQYQKAWMASFPLNLWPAVEEEKEEGIKIIF